MCWGGAASRLPVEVGSKDKASFSISPFIIATRERHGRGFNCLVDDRIISKQNIRLWDSVEITYAHHRQAGRTLTYRVAQPPLKR